MLAFSARGGGKLLSELVGHDRSQEILELGVAVRPQRTARGDSSYDSDLRGDVSLQADGALARKTAEQVAACSGRQRSSERVNLLVGSVDLINATRQDTITRTDANFHGGIDAFGQPQEAEAHTRPQSSVGVRYRYTESTWPDHRSVGQWHTAYLHQRALSVAEADAQAGQGMDEGCRDA